MIAVLGDEVVGVASVLRGHLLHEHPQLTRLQIGVPDKYRLPERKPRALPRLSFEDPRRRVIVRPVRVLHPVHCQWKEQDQALIIDSRLPIAAPSSSKR